MTRVPVVGHIEWVDFVPVEQFPVHGEVVHADGAFVRAAGGGGVVAVVLAELGAEVDFFCALGSDVHGRAAAAQLAEREVQVHAAWRHQPTRRAGVGEVHRAPHETPAGDRRRQRRALVGRVGGDLAGRSPAGGASRRLRMR